MFDKLPPPSLSSVIWGRKGEGAGEGKAEKGGRGRQSMERGRREMERYLDSQLLTQVGEQILIAISCFTVQPHNVVWAPSDPAANQLQNSPQALLLDGQGKLIL